MLPETNLENLMKRLQKRKYSYLYCHEDWLQEYNTEPKLAAYMLFARQNYLFLDTLDAQIQDTVNTQTSLHDCNGPFGLLLNYSSAMLEQFLLILASYILYQLKSLKYITAPLYQNGTEQQIFEWESNFVKTGMMYKNTLIPIYKPLAKIYSIGLRQNEALTPTKIAQFGLFCLNHILHKKVSQEFMTVLRISLPQPISRFPHFTMDESTTINTKQLELLISYLTKLNDRNNHG